MFAHLTAKAIFWACAIALAFFGIGFLGVALCTALAQTLGVAGSYALVGALFVLPPRVWALVVVNRPPPARPEPPKGSHQVVRALLAAVAKETPWIAIVGAGLAGALEMFVTRRNSRK
jgi:hypothetical protein